MSEKSEDLQQQAADAETLDQKSDSQSEDSSNDSADGESLSAELEEYKTREGKLRQQMGEDRKRFTQALNESSPNDLLKLIEGDKEYASYAKKKLGITAAGLRARLGEDEVEESNEAPEKPTSKSSFDADLVTEVTKVARDNNLSEADAKTVVELAAKAVDAGLSRDVAVESAYKQLHGSKPEGDSTPLRGSSEPEKQEQEELPAETQRFYSVLGVDSQKVEKRIAQKYGNS